MFKEKFFDEKALAIDIQNYWKEKPTEFSESIIDYINWFDKCASLQEFQKTGYIDFFHRIFNGGPIYQNIKDPGGKNCLEIGFGAGRLLSPAGKVFEKCYGIDVHNSFEKTEKILKSLGNENFKLLNFDNLENEIKKNNLEASIDFIYSFIVFQHFSSWDTAENYLKICNRLLTDEGCAKIFFGRNNENNENYIERDMYEAHACTLVVNQDFAIKKISENFKVLETGVTLKKPWINKESGQFFVVFKKK